MLIVCLADDSHEQLSLFSLKIKEYFKMSTAAVVNVT